jgi:hypothetical protein
MDRVKILMGGAEGDESAFTTQASTQHQLTPVY